MSKVIAQSPRDIQIRAARLVEREIQCNVSSLVATLAGGCGGLDSHSDTGGELIALAEQALELAAPVLDYEGAAREAGWAPTNPNDLTRTYWRNESAETSGYAHPTPEEVCSEWGIEPHELEAFEHWAVSSWLAEKLEAKGERVDRDFAGLNVWARTTTGQAIAADSVIEAITSETGYASGADA